MDRKNNEKKDQGLVLLIFTILQHSSCSLRPSLCNPASAQSWENGITRHVAEDRSLFEMPEPRIFSMLHTRLDFFQNLIDESDELVLNPVGHLSDFTMAQFVAGYTGRHIRDARNPQHTHFAVNGNDDFRYR